MDLEISRPSLGYSSFLARESAKYRQFSVYMVTPAELSSMFEVASEIHRNGGDEAAAHASIADRTLRSAFLPLFNEIGSAILYGCRPSDLCDSTAGLALRPHELGTEIVSEEGFATSFPLWKLMPSSPRGWGILMGCESISVLEDVLRTTFNPYVVSNPGASFPAVFKFAKKNSRDGRRVFLHFDVEMQMRISLTASADQCERLCAFAMKEGRFALPYAGFEWDEAKSVQPPKAAPPRKFRYSGGRLPPASALTKYPSWVPALDEEGITGQDESTIRPDDEQNLIGEFAVYTAADAELVDGRSLPALLGQPDATFLHEGEVDVLVVYDGRNPWRVDIYDKDEAWEPASEGRTKRLGDERVFPLVVRSRLPLTSGKHLVRVLNADGTLGKGV